MIDDISKIREAVSEFNKEIREIRKKIHKGYSLFVYSFNTKTKAVEDIEVEKENRGAIKAWTILGVIIIYCIILSKYPFETVLYTIVGLILLCIIGSNAR